MLRPAVTASPTRVLCVDDDPVTLRTVARILRAAGGMHVDTVGDPSEARERVLSGEYAVLLTDFDMPGTSGVSLIESIEAWCDVVPVLLTAHTGVEVALDATRERLGGMTARRRLSGGDGPPLGTVSCPPRSRE